VNASDHASDVIERDTCTCIYKTQDRFPAHADTIHLPGIWLQVHRLEREYYGCFCRGGSRPAQRAHDRDWRS